MSIDEAGAETSVSLERKAVKRSEVRVNDRADDYGTRVLDARLVWDVSPKLTTIGWGTLVVVIYGTCLYAAAIVVGELVSLLPGFAGAVVLFTIGIAAIGAAPSVAHWTVTRLFGFSR